MELKDSIEVNHSISTVWNVLTDVERIVPCLPGAQLTGKEGEEYQGTVKVKVGPVTSQYKGNATLELDDVAHRAVIVGSGRDTRGAGNASATITVQLEAVDESSTKVSVNTDLTITGKVAQFGRGVMADVSRKLMGQFATNLATLIDEVNSEVTDTADAPATGAGASGSGTAATSGSQRDDAGAPSGGATESPSPAGAPSGGHEADEVEAVDLLAVAGGSVMKRLIPALVVVAVVVIVLVVIL